MACSWPSTSFPLSGSTVHNADGDPHTFINKSSPALTQVALLHRWTAITPTLVWISYHYIPHRCISHLLYLHILPCHYSKTEMFLLFRRPMAPKNTRSPFNKYKYMSNSYTKMSSNTLSRNRFILPWPSHEQPNSASG